MLRKEAIELLAEIKIRYLSLEEREARIIEYWSIDPSDTLFQQLPNDLQEEIIKGDEPSNFKDTRYDPLILFSIIDNYYGVKNEFIAFELKTLIGEDVLVEGEAEKMFSCPCCGYLSLPDECEYSICHVCWWEDDGNRDEKIYSSANHMTLQEGKSNYKLYGVCNPNMKKLKNNESESKYDHM